MKTSIYPKNDLHQSAQGLNSLHAPMATLQAHHYRMRRTYGHSFAGISTYASPEDVMRKSLSRLLTLLLVLTTWAGCEPAVDAKKECGDDGPLVALVAVAAVNSNPNQSAQNKQTVTDLMTLYLVTYEDCVQSLKKNESLF